MCNTCGCDLTETDRHLLEGNGRHAQTGGGGAGVAVLLTKTDLLPFLGEFDPERVEANLRALANASPLQRLSVRMAKAWRTGWPGWRSGWHCSGREAQRQGNGPRRGIRTVPC